MHIPLVDLELHRPSRGSLAWYGTVGALTAVGVVEWPLAAVLTAGHLVSENTRSSAVAGAGEGIESAAG